MTSSRPVRSLCVAGLVVAALGLLGLLAGCIAPATPTPTPTPTPPPLHLTILHTNDTRGQTDPCG